MTRIDARVAATAELEAGRGSVELLSRRDEQVFSGRKIARGREKVASVAEDATPTGELAIERNFFLDPDNVGRYACTPLCLRFKIKSGVRARPSAANREVDVFRDDPSWLIVSPGSDDLTAWLVSARAGDSLAQGRLLEAFRSYLSSIAVRDVPATLRCKCDHADAVQETLLEAHRGFSRFAGRDVVEFRAWLRGILKHVIADNVRRYRDAHKRSVARELSLDSYLELGGRGDEPVDPEETPHSHAVASEQAMALEAAIDHLPVDEKMVMLLRYRDLLGFEDIGHRMGRSAEAARKLWCRAVLRLQSGLKT
jgi:RNA polymerase sigma-70 factor (ECF subfamily)